MLTVSPEGEAARKPVPTGESAPCHAPVRKLLRSRIVLSSADPQSSIMVMIEVLESPQHDWWVVQDGRVIAVHLESADGTLDAMDAAMRQARQLSPSGGFVAYTHGTTWRSAAFDHLEDIGCRRGRRCRECARLLAEEDEQWWAEEGPRLLAEAGLDPP